MATATGLMGTMEKVWDDMLAKSGGKPLEYLRTTLMDSSVRSAWVRKCVTLMREANPLFAKNFITKFARGEVCNESIGQLAEGHALIASFDKMRGSRWPAFWKADPSAERLRGVWEMAVSTGKGMDMSTRTIKLCISEDLCDVEDIRAHFFYAGYTSGSTLGAGCLLMLFMLTEIAQGVHEEASLWQLPEVNTFLLTASRLPIKFVKHASPQSRMADALATKISLNQVEETHGLIHANALIISKRSDPTWVWTTRNVEEAVADINARVGGNKAARIGDWKKRVITNVVVEIPKAVVELLQASYDTYSWERGWMSEDLLRCSWWKVGNQTTKCVASWRDVFTSSEAVLLRLVRVLHDQWPKKDWGMQDLRSVSVSVIRQKRPWNYLVDDGSGNQVPEAKMYLMFCMIIENWLLPLARQAVGDSADVTVEDCRAPNSARFSAE